ncbi:MAG: hypothetical protein V4687_03275 [Bacteroidota bacterium]
MDSSKDQEQPKANGGAQRLILDEQITGETDELNPEFEIPKESNSLDAHQPNE